VFVSLSSNLASRASVNASQLSLLAFGFESLSQRFSLIFAHFWLREPQPTLLSSPVAELVEASLFYFHTLLKKPKKFP
jgi:hypothetical protein